MRSARRNTRQAETQTKTKTAVAKTDMTSPPSAWNLQDYQNGLALAQFMRDAGVADDDRDFRHCIQQVIRFHDSHFVPVSPDTEMFIQHCH